MSERTVFEAMSRRHVLSAAPSANVHEAACKMTQANCGSILIIDAAGTLLGILTERDLMTRVLARALNPAATLVTKVMTPHPKCVSPEMRVADAVLLMIDRGFRHLPVVTDSKKILGVFSARDALPREMSAAESMAEFNDQVNDVLG